MRTNNERGSLLLLTLAVVLIVGGMVTTMLMISTTGSKRETGRDTKFKSREIAEAGLDLSLNALRQVTDQVDNDSDGQVDEGLDAYEYIVPYGHFASNVVATLEGNLGRIGTVNWTLADDANGNGWPDFGETNVIPVQMSGGEYFAYTLFSELDNIDNDGDGNTDEQDEAGSLTAIAWGRYPLVPVGELPGTQTRTSMTMYNGIFTQTHGPPNPPMWIPNAAIAAGGALTVSGTSDVMGSAGSVHSNDTVTITGGPCTIAQTASACNGIIGDTSNVLNTGGAPLAVDPAAARADLPDARPELMKHYATQIFGADGAVYDAASGAQVSPPGGNYHGWHYDAATGMWTISGGNADFNGVAYIEGDAKISGMGNSGALTMSIIATGNLQVSGNGTIHGAMAGTTDLLFMAGGDIKINGSSSQGDQVFEGLILAREQIQQTGNSDVFGAIIATGLDEKFGLVIENKITGTAQITYNGNINPDIPVLIPTNRYVLDPKFAAYEER